MHDDDDDDDDNAETNDAVYLCSVVSHGKDQKDQWKSKKKKIVIRFVLHDGLRSTQDEKLVIHTTQSKHKHSNRFDSFRTCSSLSHQPFSILLKLSLQPAECSLLRITGPSHSAR